MALRIRTSTAYSRVLRRALQGNGLFSGISGTALAVAPAQVSAFLGVDMPGLINFLGASLIAFAVALFWLAAETTIRRGLALTVIFLDLVWVADSALLLTTDVVPLTIRGMWAIVIVCGIVAAFAALQSYGLYQSRLLASRAGGHS